MWLGCTQERNRVSRGHVDKQCNNIKNQRSVQQSKRRNAQMTPVVSKELLIRFPREFTELFLRCPRPVSPDTGIARLLPSLLRSPVPVPVPVPAPSLINLFLSICGVSCAGSRSDESVIFDFVLFLVLGFGLEGNLNSWFKEEEGSVELAWARELLRRRSASSSIARMSFSISGSSRVDALISRSRVFDFDRERG